MNSTEQYLTGPQLRKRYNISEMTLHRWVKDAALNFPKPIVTRRRRYFREAEIISWERARAGKRA